MANREENLKKINTELEKLSDDELEKVAGGWSTTNNNGIKASLRETLDGDWDKAAIKLPHRPF